MKVYVGVTSWPKRIATARETIESILSQSATAETMVAMLCRSVTKLAVTEEWV